MQLQNIKILKSLNQAYKNEKVSRDNIELFKQQLTQLFAKTTDGQSEDTLKDFVTEFLRNTWYNAHAAISISFII
jgi:adenine-specific DNA-methyltransferase